MILAYQESLSIIHLVLPSPHVPQYAHCKRISRTPPFFFTGSQSSKSTQDCACLQHVIRWIPAKRGTWQRPRVHMRIPEGSLMR